jgi:hypothetical protein
VPLKSCRVLWADSQAQALVPQVALSAAAWAGANTPQVPDLSEAKLERSHHESRKPLAPDEVYRWGHDVHHLLVGSPAQPSRATVSLRCLLVQQQAARKVQDLPGCNVRSSGLTKDSRALSRALRAHRHRSPKAVQGIARLRMTQGLRRTQLPLRRHPTRCEQSGRERIGHRRAVEQQCPHSSDDESRPDTPRVHLQIDRRSLRRARCLRR